MKKTEASVLQPEMILYLNVGRTKTNLRWIVVRHSESEVGCVRVIVDDGNR